MLSFTFDYQNVNKLIVGFFMVEFKYLCVNYIKHEKDYSFIIIGFSNVLL